MPHLTPTNVNVPLVYLDMKHSMAAAHIVSVLAISMQHTRNKRAHRMGNVLGQQPRLAANVGMS